MIIKKYALLVMLMICFSVSGIAQDFVTWSYSSKKVSDNEIELTFSANIDVRYHMYSMETVDDGPMPLEFEFEPSTSYEMVGEMVSNSPIKTEYDEMFEKDLTYYGESAILTQRIKVLATEPFTIKGSLSYQICGEGTCIPGDAEFSFSISGDLLPKEAGVAGTASEEPKDVSTDKGDESVFIFILLAIGAGLGAILTPCVFPMIPMTVSFFMQGSGNKAQTITKALVFFLSVGLIYGLIGGVVAIFKNPAIAQVISSSWYMNLIFALMFIIFAASFLGMFEITLPTGFANKADKQVDKGGYVGSFFMALVLAIVSFSCTGPFVGSLLPEAASGTSVVKPILGLTCFGLAMASPFLIVAIFPSLMKKLKSGSWLNSVKVVFAFIMLGFCVKFLTQMDVDAGLDIISREVAIGFWMVLAILLGMYLLGKIKFSHDSDVKYVSVPRFALAVCSFVFAVYLIPGLFGSNLDAVSSFLPTKDRQSFDLTTLQVASVGGSAAHTVQTPCGATPKYADTKMHLPEGIMGYFDLIEAKECAKQLNKPLLIDIKGFGCTNCKKMEADAFKDQRVIDLINNEFVLVALYYDDKTEIGADEQYIVGSTAKTIGKRNTEYQTKTFGSVGGPYFAVMDADENIIKKGLGLASADELIDFLNNALEAYKK